MNENIGSLHILFGKYRILSVLGTGNSSTVYLAEHMKLNAYRAVKRIPKDAARFSSFTLEAQLLKTLNHPGIPHIYDMEEDEHFFYMIEEFVQGESLDDFIAHQSISHELILKFGIRLCDILDYLHHQMPYPILYQDLKPEHIIVCGDELKLIDFGIASFFSGSGKTYQIYGTTDFAAPEALAGQPVSFGADIYSLGKVLAYLSARAADRGSAHFQQAIQKATAFCAADRYETAQLFREALEQDFKKELKTACPFTLHLTRQITVTGSKPGVGTTHIAVSLTGVFNKNKIPALYVEAHAPCNTGSMHSMLRENPAIREQDGVFCHRFFRGIPDYGKGIAPFSSTDTVCIKDCGVFEKDIIELDPENLCLFVLSGSPWDMEHTRLAGKRLAALEHIVFLCNYDNRSAAKKLAAEFGKTVYCFPHDADAFSCTAAKEQLFDRIFSLERRRNKFLHFRKGLP